MFGNRAASVARFLSKGAKVAIEGKLRWSQWQAKDGSARSKLTVAVDEIEFLQRKGDGQRGMSAETGRGVSGDGRSAESSRSRRAALRGRRSILIHGGTLT